MSQPHRAVLCFLLALGLIGLGASRPQLPCGVYSGQALAERLIVFNRVPKVGSTALLYAFAALHKQHKIHFLHSTTFHDMSPSGSEKSSACSLLGNVSSIYSRSRYRKDLSRREWSRPLVFDQHTRFASFHSARLPTPPHINIIREPVHRLVSGYYYLIKGPREPSLMAAERRRRGDQANYTIDECLAVPLAERRCGLRGDFNLLTAFFCGHEAPCDCVGPGSRPRAPPGQTFAEEQEWSERTGKAPRCIDSERTAALARAIANIEQHYVVVGVSPLLHEFLSVIECKLPRLQGLASYPIPRAKTTAGGYETPSPAAQAELARLVDLDVALYEHVTARFSKQYHQCFPSNPPLSFD
eukprot:m.55214 g.55214  ORF g.55214 m.55214 type:complete len:356 (+) comp11949_c0_seq3:97-1164(+)